MKMMKGMNNKSISNYFLEKYRMRQKNCKFNRQDFLDEFKEYFEDLINKYPDKNPKTGCITYKTFNTLLDVVRNDWQKISSESAKPLSNGLWDAFFAQTVIPLRKMMYPRVQDKIEKSKILKREKVFLYKEFKKTYKSNI